MNFDWVTWSIWAVGAIIWLIWLRLSLKEFKDILQAQIETMKDDSENGSS